MLVEIQLAAARCLVRFWDKGAATAAMQVLNSRNSAR